MKMALRALLYMASNYFRRFRRVPGAFGKIHKTFKFQKTFIKSPSKFRGSTFSRYLRSFGNPESLVKNIQKVISASSTHNRPNSLLRAYSGLAGSVQLRHHLAFSTEFSLAAINEMSKQREGSWFGGFLSSLNRYPTLPNLANKSSSLIPKELIGTGCNSAVWSAEVVSGASVDERFLDDRTNNELAVKVLYNYYTSVDPQVQTVDPNVPLDVATSVDWVLLHRQLERECELRPSSGHPNIVPLVGHFFDRAPTCTVPKTAPAVQVSDPEQSMRRSSRSDSFTILSQCTSADSHESDSKTEGQSGQSKPAWIGADAFPEGFGGQPFTYYLLMPKFSATLDDLLKGIWSPSSEVTMNRNQEQSHTRPTGASCESSLGTTSSVISEPVSFITQPDTASSEGGSTPPFLEDVKSEAINIPGISDKTTVTATTTTFPERFSGSVLDVDEVVAILAQLFDAVAELERLGVAHRDIKPNNILIRPRPSLSTNNRSNVRQNSIPEARDHSWLDDNEVLSTNTRFHVAITDFGCAVRTTPRVPVNLQPSFLRLIGHLFSPNVITNMQPDVLTHSGNVLLLAPEIATVLASRDSDTLDSGVLSPLDYSRADLWAVATLVYPLFGQNNPFTDGTLSSATYTESELPRVPDEAPGIISWLLTNCLKRDPSVRPPADLVADVLHSWCLLRHSYRRRQSNRMVQTVKKQELPIDRGSDTIEMALRDLHLSSELEHINCSDLPPVVVNRLRAFLNVCWAADWLTGPAKPPDGLRISFYRRVTLNRLATCLRIVIREEATRAHRITSSIAAAMGPITFPVQLLTDASVQ